jgi:hypothetical protein
MPRASGSSIKLACALCKASNSVPDQLRIFLCLHLAFADLTLSVSRLIASQTP